MTDPFDAGWARAQLAEVAWARPDGTVDAAVVVPLVIDGAPGLALPFSRAGLAADLADATAVRWCLATPEVTGGAPTTSLPATVAVAEDLDGTAMDSPLLTQLIAKHPPDRRRLDSILLRREHAWYVPRLVVTTVAAGASEPFPVGEALVVRAGPSARGGPTLEVGAARHVDLEAGTATVDGVDGPAVLLRHGADVPDLERPWHHHWVGHVAGGRFTAEVRDDDPPRTAPPSLLRRMRTERQLERACRAGLRAAGHR